MHTYSLWLRKCAKVHPLPAQSTSRSRTSQASRSRYRRSDWAVQLWPHALRCAFYKPDNALSHTMRVSLFSHHAPLAQARHPHLQWITHTAAPMLPPRLTRRGGGVAVAGAPMIAPLALRIAFSVAMYHPVRLFTRKREHPPKELPSPSPHVSFVPS